MGPDTPGDALVDRFRLERRTSRRSAAVRAVTAALAFGAPLAVLCVLHARMTEPSRGAAIDRLVLAWAGLFAVAIGSCAAALVLRGPSDVALARELDRRHRKEGLFSAANFVLQPQAASTSLGSVVLARAEDALRGMPLLARVRHLKLRIKRILFFFLLSVLLALIPGGPRGALSGMGGGSEGGSSADAGPESRDATPAKAESRHDAQTPLDEIVSLILKSDHQIYQLNAEITLTVELKTKRPVASDVPVELMLVITDGLPSPDVGFGSGWRPIPLRLDWSIPKEEGSSVKQSFPMKETLKVLGVYRPGLFTADALVRPRDDGGSVSEGARSNEITFQVAENKEDLTTKTPQPQGQTKQPEKQEPDKKEDEKGSQRGKSKPKLGDPDRLPNAQKVASIVQPILNPGPMKEKDVAVFEREQGGPAPPLPVPRKPFDDTPARTFLRRPEVPQTPPDLSTEERDVLRRYFDSIRAQKKL